MEHDPTKVEAQVQPQASAVDAANGSLSSRMARRQEALSQQQTEKFPLPGWEDMLAVELRTVSTKAKQAVASRNSKIRNENERQLFAAIDVIITATVAFWRVTPDGYEPLDDDWVSLAQRLPHPPDGLTPRRAFLFLLPDHRLDTFFYEYHQWSESVGGDIDQEVVRDFEKTA